MQLQKMIGLFGLLGLAKVNDLDDVNNMPPIVCPKCLKEVCDCQTIELSAARSDTEPPSK